MTVILKDKLYIPVQDVWPEELRQYDYTFYADQGCSKCDLRSERPTEHCLSCENYNGRFKLYSKKRIKGKEYYGFPLGDRANISIPEGKVLDWRTKVPFDYDVKMQLQDFAWREDQIEVCKVMMKKKYGCFCMPPRSGKSMTALKIAVGIGYKTLFVADQRDFLLQFLEDIEKHTNLPSLGGDRRLYGFVRDERDLDDIQVGVITYQSFLSEKGKKLLRACNKVFGTVMIDEVHSSAAPQYSNVLNSLCSRVRIGFTGTYVRNDKKHVVVEKVVGPPFIETKTKQLVAKILCVETPMKTTATYAGKRGFMQLCKKLAADKARNQLIVEWAIKDIDNGHSVVIPVHFREHAFLLVKLINGHYGIRMADTFLGGPGEKNKQHRKQVKHDACTGNIKCVVGNRGLLRRGLNVPPWSALYYIMPANNKPNFKQETSRVLTVCEDKRDPILRFFVDTKSKASLRYFRHSYIHATELGHVPTKIAQERFKKNTKSLGTPVDHMEPGDEETKVARITSGGMFSSLLTNMR